MRRHGAAVVLVLAVILVAQAAVAEPFDVTPSPLSTTTYHVKNIHAGDQGVGCSVATVSLEPFLVLTELRDGSGSLSIVASQWHLSPEGRLLDVSIGVGQSNANHQAIVDGTVVTVDLPATELRAAVASGMTLNAIRLDPATYIGLVGLADKCVAGVKDTSLTP